MCLNTEDTWDSQPHFPGALWYPLSRTKALLGPTVGPSALGASLSPICPFCLSSLSSILPSHLPLFRPERRTVRCPWWQSNSIPSGSFQRYLLICLSLSDAQLQRQKLDMTSRAGTHLTSGEYSLRDLTVVAASGSSSLFVARKKLAPQPPPRV